MLTDWFCPACLQATENAGEITPLFSLAYEVVLSRGSSVQKMGGAERREKNHLDTEMTDKTQNLIDYQADLQ